MVTDCFYISFEVIWHCSKFEASTSFYNLGPSVKVKTKSSREEQQKRCHRTSMCMGVVRNLGQSECHKGTRQTIEWLRRSEVKLLQRAQPKPDETELEPKKDKRSVGRILILTVLQTDGSDLKHNSSVKETDLDRQVNMQMEPGWQGGTESLSSFLYCVN